MTIHILSYNILEGASDKLELLHRFIDDVAPDIIVFNEANFHGHFPYDLREHPHFIWHGYGQGWGNLIASRFPIVQRFAYNIYHRQPNDRGMIHVTLDVHGTRLDVSTYHPHPWRRPVLRERDYLHLLRRMEAPHRLLVGDSNALHDYPHSLDYLTQQFSDFMPLERAQRAVPLFHESGCMLQNLLHSHGWVDLAQHAGSTIPTDLIRTNDSDMRIDVVYGYNIQGTTERIKNNITEQLSDHYPLLTALDLPS